MSSEERERFFSRLATIAGLRTMPSIGAWILVQVDHPAELARKINRRMDPGTVSVPRNLTGAIRIPVRDPKFNERLYKTVRDLMQSKERHRFYEELRAAAVGD